MSILARRVEALERRHDDDDGGRCCCVLSPPLEADDTPQALLCPHGRPWAITVVYDETPLIVDDGDPPAGGEGQHGRVG